MEPFLARLAVAISLPYPFALLVLGLIAFCFRKTRPICRNILQVMNLLLAAGATILFALYLKDLAKQFQSTTGDERNLLISCIRGPYWWAYWARTLWTVFPLLFWVKKLRTKIWISAVAGVFVFLNYFLERLIIVVTSLYRDYRPARWIYYPAPFREYLSTAGIYVLLVAGTYALLFVIRKRARH